MEFRVFPRERVRTHDAPCALEALGVVWRRGHLPASRSMRLGGDRPRRARPCSRHRLADAELYPMTSARITPGRSPRARAPLRAARALTELADLGVTLVEDAAQAFAPRSRRRFLLTFSLFPTKNLFASRRRARDVPRSEVAERAEARSRLRERRRSSCGTNRVSTPSRPPCPRLPPSLPVERARRGRRALCRTRSRESWSCPEDRATSHIFVVRSSRRTRSPRTRRAGIACAAYYRGIHLQPAMRYLGIPMARA